jgi:hypothetical protein
VCYKKGGYLAITDANLQLGRILPETFPKIFGPNEVGGWLAQLPGAEARVGWGRKRCRLEATPAGWGFCEECDHNSSSSVSAANVHLSVFCSGCHNDQWAFWAAGSVV